MSRESAHGATSRWARLEILQQHYKHFITFLEDGMEDLGFDVTEIQEDIAEYMEHGPQNIMIEAQRSQAKTTIAALFCVWCLIHSPMFRVLIISAGGSQASDISILIVRLIMNMDVLECLRPDKNAGDRVSTEAFDVHHSLKGLDKSPSVKCMGITANMQGNRADILLADDIESSKNAATATQRAQLLHLTKDFTSIVQKGRVIWLGTPQTGDSIYNSLPSRGVQVRIWPGRFPTVEQEENYGNHLAPLIQRKMLADPGLRSGGGMLGDQGKPIDPALLDEHALQKKELDQGAAYFQLQHMLNTKLLDSMRFPLKPELLVTLSGAGTTFPLTVVRGMERHHLLSFTSSDFAFEMKAPHETSRETAKLESIWAYVDPAAGGANGDETAYAVGGILNSNIYLLSVGGVPGGYDEYKLKELISRLVRFPINGVTIEKNMGYGAFTTVLTPLLRQRTQCAIEDDLVSGQKERRIINTLAPVMGRGALIVTPEAVIEDDNCCRVHAPNLRQSYSVFYQMAKISEQRNALLHDDRLDAVEGLVRHFQSHVAQDQLHKTESMQAKAHAERLASTLKSLGISPAPASGRSILRHRRR